MKIKCLNSNKIFPYKSFMEYFCMKDLWMLDLIVKILKYARVYINMKDEARFKFWVFPGA